MRPVTLRDVADAASVSTAAVSKVLHGSGSSIRVSPDRAQHIRETAERLNYRVNAVARNLRKSKTQTIGVLFENLRGLSDGPMYITNLLDGVASVCFLKHYRLTVLAEVDHRDVLGSLGDGQLDGVIWCKLARDKETLAALRNCPIPIVALNAAAPDSGSCVVHVNCDNEGGIALAVDHLVSLRHTRINFIQETQERSTPDTVARREAFARRVAAYGLEPVVTEWDWELEGIAEHLKDDGCTAALCWSESLAGRLLGRLNEAGISVPDEISLVGFDSTLYCETTEPKLAAIRQPIREMGAYAAEALISLIAGERPAIGSTIFPCTFDVRGSTCPPGASGA